MKSGKEKWRQFVGKQKERKRKEIMNNENKRQLIWQFESEGVLAQMGERSLSMREVLGSIPRYSSLPRVTFFIFTLLLQI